MRRFKTTLRNFCVLTCFWRSFSLQTTLKTFWRIFYSRPPHARTDVVAYRIRTDVRVGLRLEKRHRNHQQRFFLRGYLYGPVCGPCTGEFVFFFKCPFGGLSQCRLFYTFMTTFSFNFWLSSLGPHRPGYTWSFLLFLNRFTSFFSPLLKVIWTEKR